MQLKPEDISKIIKSQIEHYDNRIETAETGTVDVYKRQSFSTCRPYFHCTSRMVATKLKV